MRGDPWFTRGWNGTDWRRLAAANLEDDKEDDLIRQEIEAAATITAEEFRLFRASRPDEIPISRRMQWAANRQVTREEDAAYSLMGIFGVSISIAYGEGAERAFFRLVKEIMNTSTSNVLDIANWGIGPHALTSSDNSATRLATSLLVPSSPKNYLWRANTNIQWYNLTAPTMIHLGVHLPVLLMPALSVDSTKPDSPFHNPVGRYYARVQIDSQDPQDPSSSLPPK